MDPASGGYHVQVFISYEELYEAGSFRELIFVLDKKFEEARLELEKNMKERMVKMKETVYDI